MNSRIETGPGRGLSLDANAFLVTAATGVILMLGLKALGVPQLAVTLVVAAVVVAYSVAVVKLGRLHLRLDQAGDNAYYLGLVFTLTSMAVALWQIGRQSGFDLVPGAPSVVESVIGNFGLALGSTLAGIVCRIVLHQMRLDPADVEAEARVQLARAAAGMVGQLDTLAQSFGEHTAKLQQKQQDHATELSEIHKQMREELVAAVREAAGATTESMTDVTGRMYRSMEALAAMIHETTSALTEAVERLQAVEPPPTRLSKRFDVMTGKVEELTTSIQRSAEGLSTALGEFRTLAADLGQGVAAASVSLPEAVRRIEQTQASLGDLGTSIAGARTAAEQMREDATRSTAAVAHVEESAAQVLERLTQVVQSIEVTPARRGEPGNIEDTPARRGEPGNGVLFAGKVTSGDGMSSKEAGMSSAAMPATLANMSTAAMPAEPVDLPGGPMLPGKPELADHVARD